MSDDGESPISRWSRLKRGARDGKPAPDAPAPPEKKRGGAAPVAGRRLVRSLPPLADADQDADDPYAAPPIVTAYGLPPEPAPTEATADGDGEGIDDDRELTPEEEDAVKDLPPIESLNKDSDFTPFLADKVPGFIRRKALSVLWRSDPLLAGLDGLNDYDEDFTLAAVIAESLAEAREARKLAKAAKAKAKQAGDADQAAETADAGAGDDAGDDVGDADGDIETADPDQDRLPEEDDDEPDFDADNVRPPGAPPRRH